MLVQNVAAFTRAPQYGCVEEEVEEVQEEAVQGSCFT